MKDEKVEREVRQRRRALRRHRISPAQLDFYCTAASRAFRDNVNNIEAAQRLLRADLIEHFNMRGGKPQISLAVLLIMLNLATAIWRLWQSRNSGVILPGEFFRHTQPQPEDEE